MRSFARRIDFAALALVLMGALAAVASAQTYNFDTDREAVVPLTGLSRFHAGDDLRWADP